MTHRKALQPESMQARSSVTANETIDTSYLESLAGYNARRATLILVEAFLREMAVFDLRPTEFSVLSLIAHNPGITSRQLCNALNIQPPNLVGMVNAMEKRELVMRQPHPRDGRALGLHLTPAGKKMMRNAEQTAARAEQTASAHLSAAERTTLMHLLKKIYS
jgi:DNA-binding MarR family transcriptional regulator